MAELEDLALTLHTEAAMVEKVAMEQLITHIEQAAEVLEGIQAMEVLVEMLVNIT